MPVPPVQENVNIGMTASTVIEKYALDAVSSSATSTTVTLTNNTASSVSVQYILAAYTADGQMVASSTVASDLQSQKSIKLTVQYSAKDQVSWVSAFVLQAGTYSRCEQCGKRPYEFRNLLHSPAKRNNE